MVHCSNTHPGSLVRDVHTFLMWDAISLSNDVSAEESFPSHTNTGAVVDFRPLTGQLPKDGAKYMPLSFTRFMVGRKSYFNFYESIFVCPFQWILSEVPVTRWFEKS